ncbi:hypothetical protein LAZ40_11335 [Cereibacter sphaeroides]|uniref:DUF6036 family nucleotidyltransferase n=1 Tax=Cereibacter sphaeroides TaxID=1063 RepID=UPI001F47B56D|nr:DUF6036 family nucleotidyltransferase [Cereibacter sphaeroides]MCE6959626.1 hypothetical protein [Cereibacter sphaeroides]MCE6974513.1 hypothetical protein [Cereibacter sphaeroides]
MTDGLDKNRIRDLLMEIAERAKQMEVLIEMSVYGGAVMVMEYNSRVSTRDVDVVVHSGGSSLKKIIDAIATEHDLDAAWLNDGVKGFISAHPKLQDLFLETEHGAGLRVLRPSPEYLLAMKAMAMRSVDADASSDIDDIRFLLREMNITSHEQALDIVAGFYPSARISAKTVFGLQEIIEGLAAEDPLQVALPKGPGDT